MIRSSEVPTPFERGTRATELESSGALVERPLDKVLPLPSTGPRKGALCDVFIIYHMISKKEQLGSLSGNIQAPCN